MGDETKGRKFDNGKRRWSLLPWGALEVVVDVLEFGARKYEVDNWKHVPDARKRYTDALLRHVAEVGKGNWTDDETGLPHTAHAACCCLFLLYLDSRS